MCIQYMAPNIMSYVFCGNRNRNPNPNPKPNPDPNPNPNGICLNVLSI